MSTDLTPYDDRLAARVGAGMNHTPTTAAASGAVAPYGMTLNPNTATASISRSRRDGVQADLGHIESLLGFMVDAVRARGGLGDTMAGEMQSAGFDPSSLEVAPLLAIREKVAAGLDKLGKALDHVRNEQRQVAEAMHHAGGQGHVASDTAWYQP